MEQDEIRKHRSQLMLKLAKLQDQQAEVIKELHTLRKDCPHPRHMHCTSFADSHSECLDCGAMLRNEATIPFSHPVRVH